MFISIFLLFTPFTSAYPIEGEKIAAVLEQLSPFIYLNSVSDYSIKFDEQKAHNAGISQDAIKIGKEYESFHNQAVSSIKQRGIYDAKLVDQTALKQFEPFFLFVAETGMMHQKTLTTPTADVSGTVPLIRIVKQKGVEQNTKNKNRLIDVCGGSREHPHHCPARVPSRISRSSSSAMSTYLISSGFHNTYYPGCGTARPSCPGFTRWISTYSCASGIFRTEAWLTGSGSSWSYSTQTPEPNPEIFSYGWPVWWWYDYVSWWHSAYCN